MADAACVEWTATVMDDGATGERPGRTGFVDVLVRRLPRLRRIAAGMGFGPADADDILQSVYLEAAERPGEYRGEEESARWLTRVTVNRCLAEHRRRKRFTEKASDILERAGARGEPRQPDRDAIREEEVDLIREAMIELDAAMLAPLVLRYFEDMDATQIGRVLNLPPATVRTRLRRARMLLAKQLIERGIEP